MTWTTVNGHSPARRTSANLTCPRISGKHANLGQIKDFLGFIELVKSFGEWDYKNTISLRLENFGNFHFGVVGAAFMSKFTLPVPISVSPGARSFVPVPFPKDIGNEVLLMGAGLVHILDTRGGEGIPFLIAPYGDDPKDQAWIRLGMRFLPRVECCYGATDGQTMIRADLWRCVRRIICRHSKCRIVYIKVKTVFGLWWCPAVNLPDFQSPFSTTGLSCIRIPHDS